MVIAGQDDYLPFSFSCSDIASRSNALIRHEINLREFLFGK